MGAMPPSEAGEGPASRDSNGALLQQAEQDRAAAPSTATTAAAQKKNCYPAEGEGAAGALRRPERSQRRRGRQHDHRYATHGIRACRTTTRKGQNQRTRAADPVFRGNHRPQVQGTHRRPETPAAVQQRRRMHVRAEAVM